MPRKNKRRKNRSTHRKDSKDIYNIFLESRYFLNKNANQITLEARVKRFNCTGANLNNYILFESCLVNLKKKIEAWSNKKYSIFISFDKIRFTDYNNKKAIILYRADIDKKAIMTKLLLECIIIFKNDIYYLNNM